MSYPSNIELEDSLMIFVGEYSASQDAFHVQLLGKALSSNRQRALCRELNDWIPFAVGDEELVRRAVEAIKQDQLLRCER